MNEASPSWAGWLVAWLADYYVLATFFFLLFLLARRWIRQPAHRMMVAWTVTIELVALAVVCALPFWPRLSLVPRVGTGEPPAVLAAGDDGVMPPSGSMVLDPDVLAPRAAKPAQPAPRLPLDDTGLASQTAPAVSAFDWRTWLAVAYLTGVAAAGLWLGWGAATALWVCRRARPAPEALQEQLRRLVPGAARPPRLLVSSQVATAVALGVFRPTILLPAGLAREDSPGGLRAVLAHELAHLRHRDLWLLSLGRGLLLLLFAHPLLWLMRRAIRDDQEWLADAAAAGRERHLYARELLRVIRMTASPGPLHRSAAVAIWESPSQLSRRIAMLLDETFHVDPAGSRSWRLRALALFAILGVAGSLVTLQPARSEGEPSPPSAQDKPGESGDPAPAKPAKDAAASEDLTRTGYGVLTIAEFASEGADASPPLYLPGFEPLTERAVLEELKITDAQKTQLSEIAKQYSEGMAEINKARRDSPPEEIMKEQRQWQRDHRKPIRRQVEAILDPRQLDRLDEMVLHRAAGLCLNRPGVLGALNATAQQRDQISRVELDAHIRLRKNTTRAAEKALALLDPAQRERLTEAVLGPDGPVGPQYYSHQIEGELLLIPVHAHYPDISLWALLPAKDALGLNDEQRRRVHDILGNNVTLVDRLLEEARRLSPEQRAKLRAPDVQFNTVTVATTVASSAEGDSPEARKEGQAALLNQLRQRAEFLDRLRKQRAQARANLEENPLWKTSEDLRKRLEAVLTPDQLATYRQTAVRRQCPYVLQDPLVAEKVALTDPQRATLDKLLGDLNATHWRWPREVGQKILEILTPPQRQKLREIADRGDLESLSN
ncbi:MAG: M56 family metallopeptidase [Pirellulales bacterium]|nr:M56 family metallopeptidase [Pirellulales bacterium]